MRIILRLTPMDLREAFLNIKVTSFSRKPPRAENAINDVLTTRKKGDSRLSDLKYFPEIYDDELLYSAIARYQLHMRNRSSRQTSMDLFKKPAAHVVADLPKKISLFVDVTGLGKYISAHSVIEKHTLYPFYTAFIGAKRRNKVFWSMFGGAAARKYGTNGVGANASRFLAELRYCPDCLREDIESHGEPYWHRIHMAPGVKVCPEHKRKLMSSCEECGDKLEIGGQHYHPLRAACRNGHPLYFSRRSEGTDEHSVALLGYAQDVKILLETRIAFEPGKLKEIYRSRLFELGWEALFHQEMARYYGESFLNSVGLTQRQPFWPMAVIKGEDHDPMRHLLVIRRMFGSLKQMIEGSYDCDWLLFQPSRPQLEDAMVKESLINSIA